MTLRRRTVVAVGDDGMPPPARDGARFFFTFPSEVRRGDSRRRRARLAVPHPELPVRVPAPGDQVAKRSDARRVPGAARNRGDRRARRGARALDRVDASLVVPRKLHQRGRRRRRAERARARRHAQLSVLVRPERVDPPVDTSTDVCAAPAATARAKHAPSAATGFGSEASSQVSCPSWPYKPHPNVHTRPSASTRALCLEPAATCVIFTSLGIVPSEPEPGAPASKTSAATRAPPRNSPRNSPRNASPASVTRRKCSSPAAR